MEHDNNKSWQVIMFAFFITVNIALAVFSRSPAAYESLKSFKILALPSVSTLKDYKSMLVCGLREVDKRLRKERELYDGIVSKAVGKQKRMYQSHYQKDH